MRRVLEYAKISFRIQLIVICFFCVFIASGVSNYINSQHVRKAQQLTPISPEEVQRIGNKIATRLSQTPHSFIQSMLNQASSTEQVTLIVSDVKGNVLYDAPHQERKQIDIYDIQKQVARYVEQSPGTHPIYTITPVRIAEANLYVIVQKNADAKRMHEYYTRGSVLPAMISFGIFLAVFFFLFYMLTRKKMKQIEELSQAMTAISQGNLDYRAPEISRDELGQLAREINHMSAELRSIKETEQETEKAKQKLITNVSHDLRTPLTSIIGYLQIIEERRYRSEEEKTHYLSIVTQKSKALKKLIDDLFEYTKLSRHMIKFHKETIPINRLLAQLTEEMIPLAEENELSFEQNYSESGLLVHGDPHQIVRLFENLLINAIKYSNPGVIKIQSSKIDTDVIIEIQNKGTPIPQEVLPRLFERFYKVDPSRASSPNSSGLGLAIAKSIVELHGGQIWAECRDNTISFFVRFPLCNE